MCERKRGYTLGPSRHFSHKMDVLARQFPQVINRPIVAKSGSMTLDKAMKLGAAYVPKRVIQETLEELRRL